MFTDATLTEKIFSMAILICVLFESGAPRTCTRCHRGANRTSPR
ncbi:hypothetical protein L843_4664 [Mycobacterium intracellulare MIN_061107_1834]|nr:hypothetical protein L843_4664 [Mycobacterium intracellulare MIN_061107_1834]